MSKAFGIVDGTTPQIPLWNYNLQRTLGNGGAFISSDAMNVAAGVDLPIGTPLQVDLSTRKVHVVKNALVTGGTTSAPQVAKGHYFEAGDAVYVSGTAVTISSIDTTNASYDVLTLSGACAGAITGQYLENAVAAGASPALKYSANAILQEAVYDVEGGEPVTAVIWIFSDVDTSRFPVPISPVQIGLLNATGRFLLY